MYFMLLEGVGWGDEGGGVSLMSHTIGGARGEIYNIHNKVFEIK